MLVDGRNRMSSLIPDIAASSRWAEWWQALECRGCEMSVRAKVVDSHVRLISHKECPLEIKQRKKHCPSPTPSIRPSSSRLHLVTAVKWVGGRSWGPPRRLTLRHNTWLLDYFWVKLTFLAKRLCIQPWHVQVLLFHSSISSSRLSKLWSYGSASGSSSGSWYCEKYGWARASDAVIRLSVSSTSIFSSRSTAGTWREKKDKKQVKNHTKNKINSFFF